MGVGGTSCCSSTSPLLLFLSINLHWHGGPQAPRLQCREAQPVLCAVTSPWNSAYPLIWDGELVFGGAGLPGLSGAQTGVPPSRQAVNFMFWCHQARHTLISCPEHSWVTGPEA